MSWGNPDLEQVISQFPMKLKQAMYASAMEGPINRGTWNHCALNAAGDKIKSQVSGFAKAAEAFGITQKQASLFVHLWDSRTGSDEFCTEYLKVCLLQAGLFTEPVGTLSSKIRVKKILFSEASKDKIEFEKMMFENQIENVDLAFELLTLPASELVDA